MKIPLNNLTTSFLNKIFNILFIYFYRGRKRGREKSVCGCLSSTPYWEPVPQPRHVPCLGIEPETLWFTVLKPLSHVSQGLTLHLKELEEAQTEPKVSKRKEIIKIRADINKTKSRKTTQNMNQTNSWFF